ncbi:AAA family ATPase [Nguyenibacter vanlangensis]|uniref:AAA family ATPase n=1 Tax=Nguyenibacter vanlangensis TaxID=1216886 RepID=A0ABZ3D1M5_9PROT
MQDEDNIIVIRPAEREGARLIFCFSGTSGSGKTRTALEFAYGLTNYDPGKIGFLDTENRRGSLYADVLKAHKTRPTNTPFLIADLDAPFSPDRYKRAVLAFQRAGVEVLIVDSYSHMWEGIGGCSDIAAKHKSVQGWKIAKDAHKDFINAILSVDMHIILCIRAREQIDATDPRNIKSLGVQPICEKNLMFEMTASMMMDNEGKHQDVIKCPGELQPFLGRGQGYITSEDGAAVRAWVDGGKPIDPATERAFNTLRSVAEGGMRAYRAEWNRTPESARKALEADGRHETLKAQAAAFDRQRERVSSDADGLNEQRVE